MTIRSISRFKARTKKEAYSTIPQAAIDYIKSLPEYNEAIFNQITGRVEND